MARVTFTSHLARHVSCPAEVVRGATLREALEAYFARHPLVRPYVLDEQGAVRKHIALFVNDEMTRTLTQPVADDTEIYVMQALSGG